MLTGINGTTVASDAIGNITNDGTWTFTWKNGRQLATMSKSGTTWNFFYDASGMRTQRTNGSTTYKYTYEGTTLTQMTVGSNTLILAYGVNGHPMGVKYNGTSYYYVTNAFGDVVAIADGAGNEVVTYNYDAWGNILSTGGSMASTLGAHNPLRYRSYVYDQETKLYYLQSRYYNPAICRFISADSISYLGADGTPASYNLFAYCGNNPVMGYDPSGNWSAWSTAGVVVGSVLCIAAVTILTCGVGTATLVGAVAVSAAKGALIGAGVGTAVGAGIGYATTGTLEGTFEGAAIGFGAGAVIGAITGGVSGYSRYSSAANFLKSNGANPKDVLSSYKGIPKVQTLNADTTVYRTWGGTTKRLGHWISPNNYGSSARSLLSLPTGNTMTNTSSFLIQKGTTVLTGKAAPLFGQLGGGVQWWIAVLG